MYDSTPQNASRSLVLTVTAIALTGLLAACGDPDDSSENQANEDQWEPACELQLPEDGEPFETLSEYCFFGGDPAGHRPNEGVVPFEPTSTLYSDRSHKRRFIVLPEGETIGFHADQPWQWPDGAIIVKTFFFPDDMSDPEAGRQLIETRLLEKRDGSWEPEIYTWNDDQTAAEHYNYGDQVDIEFTDFDGGTTQIDYRIPDANQCITCHGQDGDFVPIGPRTRQLNAPYGGDTDRPAQLAEFDELGMFDEPIPDPSGLPAITDPDSESDPLADRARSYLDVNCGACHNPDGRAGSSNLFLNLEESDENNLGICKTPVAAGQGSGGRSYDIVPGEPDESILIYRMESTDPEIKMPELPITTVDDDGVDLMREWIAGMESTSCE